MKTKLIIGSTASVLIAASVATNVVVLKRLIQTENTVAHKLSVVETKVDSFQPHQIVISEKELNILTDNIVRRNNDEAKILSDSISELKNSQIETHDKLNSVANIIRDVDAFQKNSITRAEKSFVDAKTLYESGNSVDAKRYMLNAISHSPENFDYLRYFCTITLNDPKVTYNELEMTLNLVDSLLYKIPAEKINATLEIREELNSRKENLVAQVVTPQINIDVELNELNGGNLSLAKIVKNGIPDMEVLKKRIEKISMLLSEEQLSDELSSKLIAWAEESTVIYSSQQVLNNVENALEKAGSHAGKSVLKDEEILAARNQLSTANTILSQIWIMNVPDYIVQKAQNMQIKISEIDKKLNILASQKGMKRYYELVAEINRIKENVEKVSVADYASRKNYDYENKWRTGELTGYLMQIEQYVGELNSLRIYDDHGRKEVRNTLINTQKLVQQIINKRYKAYNKWAIDKIEAARKSRDSVTIGPYTNERAVYDFWYLLADIDRGLLTYDVGTCYDNMHTRIFVEQIPDAKKAELQYNKATFDKMGRLEDF